MYVADKEPSWDWGEDYRPRRAATPSAGVQCSALWRGYRSVYRVDASARLSFVAFEYPFDRYRSSEVVDEPISGDVWLRLSEDFAGPAVMVPVKCGVVQAREQWLFELERGRRYVLESDLRDGDWPPPSPPDAAEARERALPCDLVVRGDGLVLADYWVYLDRNVVRTPHFFTGRAPANGVYVRLSSGPHIVTLRTPYVGSPDREASNTLKFELETEQSIEIIARRTESGLSLDVCSRDCF